MTEQDWLDSANPQTKVAWLEDKASERKFRLFVAGFWHRQVENLSGDDRAALLRRTAVMESWADTGKLGKGFRRSHSPHIVFFASSGFTAARNTTYAPLPWVKTRRQWAIAVQRTILNDIFGPLPFRPVTLNAAWRTSNVTVLAQSIYDDRAFDRLPILADALEDAGCDNADILNHCREPGEHVRGCWVSICCWRRSSRP
jgi:hypothetical protein